MHCCCAVIADPHPGNVAVDAQGRLIYYDFGMTGSIPGGVKGGLMELFYGVYERDADRWVGDVGWRWCVGSVGVRERNLHGAVPWSVNETQTNGRVVVLGGCVVQLKYISAQGTKHRLRSVPVDRGKLGNCGLCTTACFCHDLQSMGSDLGWALPWSAALFMTMLTHHHEQSG